MFNGKRIARLEEELAGLRAALADLRADVRTGAAVDAERAQAAGAIGTIGDRLAELAGRSLAQSDRAAAVDRLEAGQAALDGRLARLEADLHGLIGRHDEAQSAATGQRDDLSRLRSAVAAVEQQVRLQATDTARLVTGLVQRFGGSRATAARTDRADPVDAGSA